MPARVTVRPVWLSSSCALPSLSTRTVSIRSSSDALNVSGEVRGAAIVQPDPVELERHLGPARDSPGAVDLRDMAFDVAPSYREGDRTVKVKRSPSRACFVLRLSFRTATSWVPSGTMKSPWKHRPQWSYPRPRSKDPLRHIRGLIEIPFATIGCVRPSSVMRRVTRRLRPLSIG